MSRADFRVRSISAVRAATRRRTIPFLSAAGAMRACAMATIHVSAGALADRCFAYERSRPRWRTLTTPIREKQSLRGRRETTALTNTGVRGPRHSPSWRLPLRARRRRKQ